MNSFLVAQPDSDLTLKRLYRSQVVSTRLIITYWCKEAVATSRKKSCKFISDKEIPGRTAAVEKFEAKLTLSAYLKSIL